MKRDTELRLRAALRNSIPFILGSAGRAGRAPDITRVREIIEEIADEQGLHFRPAIIHPEQDKVCAFEKPREQARIDGP